ncbi:DUF5685 family protein [Kiritimatiellaeota bacterium B1221]|nr:DUF5685 family protein [Kiritimatiellaeota bacterium B1221]
MFGFLTAPCSACRSQEHSVYRAHFCGLCNRLRQDYGLPMRFLVNRDATFLSILGNALAATQEAPQSATCCNPLGKPRWVVQEGDPVSYAAAVTLCGLKAKLDDEVADRRSWLTGMPVRGLRGALSGQIAKAELRLNRLGFPVDAVAEALEEQTHIEKHATAAGKAHLDDLSRPSAFSFGKIVAHTGGQARETLEEIGQSLGRVIYSMDAWMDRKQDQRTGQFNPFLLQPGLMNTVPAMVERDLYTISSGLRNLPLSGHRELLDLILGRNLQKTCARILEDGRMAHSSSANQKKRKQNHQSGPAPLCDFCDVFLCCDCGNVCDCGDTDCSGGCCDCGCDCDVCCCDC